MFEKVFRKIFGRSSERPHEKRITNASDGKGSVRAGIDAGMMPFFGKIRYNEREHMGFLREGGYYRDGEARTSPVLYVYASVSTPLGDRILARYARYDEQAKEWRPGFVECPVFNDPDRFRIISTEIINKTNKDAQNE